MGGLDSNMEPYKRENYVALWNHINGKIIQQHGTI